jgi:hypothetical protein
MDRTKSIGWRILRRIRRSSGPVANWKQFSFHSTLPGAASPEKPALHIAGYSQEIER